MQSPWLQCLTCSCFYPTWQIAHFSISVQCFALSSCKPGKHHKSQHFVQPKCFQVSQAPLPQNMFIISKLNYSQFLRTWTEWNRNLDQIIIWMTDSPCADSLVHVWAASLLSVFLSAPFLANFHQKFGLFSFSILWIFR